MSNQDVPLSPAVRAAKSVRGEFLVGKQVESSPKDVQGFRKQLFQFLQSQGIGTAIQGAPQDMNFDPYRQAFAQRRAETLAAAKEGAGNLTGSGFANIYGAAAGRSVADENSFLAQLQEQARQSSANRFLQLLQIPQGYVGQMTHQPGLLDYAFQGAKAAAPFFQLGGGPGGIPAAPDVSGFDPSTIPSFDPRSISGYPF